MLHKKNAQNGDIFKVKIEGGRFFNENMRSVDGDNSVPLSTKIVPNWEQLL